MIDQVTVCLPNEPGSLAKVCHLLGEVDIQIHAIMIADTTDFSTVRLICDRPAEAEKLLASKDYTVMLTQVVAVEVTNEPGGLAALLDHLSSCDLNLEYAYTCSIEGRTIDIIKVTGEPLEVKLQESNLVMVPADQIYARPDA